METTAVCSDIYGRSALCGQNGEFLQLTPLVHELGVKGLTKTNKKQYV